MSAGLKLRKAVEENNPLQVMGTITAYAARMAEQVGHKAVYLSGGGVAANSLGMPDLGISTAEDLLVDIRRITDVCSLPLLVDIDTGFGGAFNIARTTRSLIKAGAAGFHMEDQVAAKRCGHRPNKEIVSQQEMVDRIKAAVDARTDENFVIMARTDALGVEGMQSAIDRSNACLEAGADMIFPEAMSKLEDYKYFREHVNAPILANITEFGQTPLFSCEELGEQGVDIVLYCCGAYRAMNKAAETFYRDVLEKGHQRDVVEIMQTREELYNYLGYHEYEQKLDQLFAEGKEK
ncbi:methylisocitrate lyase [Kangiella sediminilitoris]|uniref:2-methylisocitrate lyase n=1 Tax=Kangiella sediminilitoris TaxID=1144748 RepID=A0A1B3B9Y1_9GAMM|nr:methylisocitrate lyase [Kangiella sediminilitoris]AOE49585.1 2-methylisocitrate lyase [Kangiella sediminilitoris]